MFLISEERIPAATVQRSTLLSEMLHTAETSGPLPVTSEAVQEWMQQAQLMASSHTDRSELRSWQQIVSNMQARCSNCPECQVHNL